MSASENINCLKNFIQLTCCDGKIHPREKAFLFKAAKELSVEVADWNALLKDVLKDDTPFYPIENRDKAIAALKALVVLAKADGKVDPTEKKFVTQFAKTVGVNKSEWKQIMSDIDEENLFTLFCQPAGEIVAIQDDFEKLDAFLDVAQNHSATIESVELKAYLQAASKPSGVVCFHAAGDKDVSVTRCELLLSSAADSGLICILNRYQGHQVKYLHEAGLKKCVIEPVYGRDIQDIFQHAQQ